MAEQKGNFIRKKLEPFLGEQIVDIRGLGLEIGIELKNSKIANKVINHAYSKGLHAIVSNETNLQLMPPLTIPQELLEEGLEILSKAICAFQ